MSRGTSSDAVAENVRSLLADPRYELMPFESMGEQLELLPAGAEVAITTSPTLGLDATIEWTHETADRGFEVVPHIAARYVRDADHLEEVVGQLKEAGVDDIFVPGGDREEPLGEFESAHDMLVELEKLDYEFEGVGISGYPEGHDFISDAVLETEMAKKEPYSTYIVTQLCYDPDAVVTWIDEIRDDGIRLPIEVGIPGVMKYQRLLGISQKVGVGDSVRFLRKTSGILGFVKQLAGSRGKYTPDDLIEGIALHADDPHYDIRGLHLYAFNQVSDLEDWRLEKLGDATD